MAPQSANVGRWVGLIYCTFAAGFGGWCGHDFGTWTNSLTVVLPPVLFAVVLTLRTLGRGSGRVVLTLLVLAVVAGSLLGGMGLLIAWLASVVAGPWADPVVRVAVPALTLAAIYGFGLYLQRKPTNRPG